MRLLFITLEYALGSFSGNGALSTSSVRSLRAAGHTVAVLCGAPPDAQPGLLAFDTWAVPLPSWNRLDSTCSHGAFAAAIAADSALHVWAASAAPQLVLGVDFHALPAFQALHLKVPFIWLPYRAFARFDPPALPLERAAAAAASLIIALCDDDAAFIRGALEATASIAVLPPPLRAEVAEAAAAMPMVRGSAARRSLLACVVRLSREKEPERFVALVEALVASGALQRLQFTPALVGVPQDEFGRALQARLRAAAPDALIIDTFLGPAELGERVFARTRLNVHPPLADAFGMTVMEAAAWGAPSLMHSGRAVGAAALLPPPHASLAMDLTMPPQKLAAAVEAALLDGEALASVAVAAMAVAERHTEEAHAAATGRLLAAMLLDSAPEECTV